MEKQEVRSNWDELARELGAEAPPESERPTLAPSAAAPPAEPAKPLAPPPKRSAADWNQLAGELGLPPVPAPPPKPAARETPPELGPSARKPAAASEPARETRSERTERTREPVGPSQRPARPPRQRDNERDNERGGGPSGGERDSRRGGRRRGRRHSEDEQESSRKPETAREQESTRPREPARRQESSHEHETPVSKPDRPAQAERAEERPAETPPSKPAVSLWQKIFGALAEPVTKPGEAVVDRAFDDEPADDRRDDVVLIEETVTDSFSEEAIDSRAEPSRDAKEGGDDPGDQESGEQKRRRPRRRRGGRGRKTGDSQDARRPASRRRREPELLETPGADDFDDDFDDLPVGDADAGDPDAVATFDDELGEDAGDESNGDAAPARGRSAGHRSIPSWDEAIGIIVETNMQSRSQRRPSGNSGQRGRPRGGRRRRKPS
ncbi:MAG: hypothetical protein WD669_10800 [Pirellulales bacterium]